MFIFVSLRETVGGGGGGGGERGGCRRLERGIFRVWPLNIALVKNQNEKQTTTTTKLDFSKQGSFNR